MLILAGVLWWTFSVVVFVWIVNDQSHEGFIDWAKTITLATMWPLFAPFAVVALVYHGLVASTKQIRNDLRNRKLLDQFEQWLKTRE